MRTALLKHLPLFRLNIQEDHIRCLTRGSNRTGDHGITVRFGGAERHLQGLVYHYTHNPNITTASPSKSFLRWVIRVDRAILGCSDVCIVFILAFLSSIGESSLCSDYNVTDKVCLILRGR